MANTVSVLRKQENITKAKCVCTIHACMLHCLACCFISCSSLFSAHSRENSYLPLDLSTPPLPAMAALTSEDEGGAYAQRHVMVGEDMIAVKQHLHRLSRRVLYLEQLHERTALRDKVFYPMVMGYLLFQFLKWCAKS